MIVLLAATLSLGGFASAGEDDDSESTSLLDIKKLYVDKLSGGETAVQMRDMIISSLLNSKLFALTENEERADTFLRGSSEDLVFTDEHQTSDSINAQLRGSAGGGSKDASYRSTGAGVGQNESSRVYERKHEASAAVRLVNKDGDVIWSTTQESMGGKFRGSSADVADKISRKLIDDVRKARAEAAAVSRKEGSLEAKRKN
ncbi:MAG: hypothetical protein M3Z23_16660 [Acidobacteriota bacterium]|nr:hypothetical protein [Acidobacteriota bacterium]